MTRKTIDHLDVNSAYRLAGVAVATLHSQFHHLEGDLPLDPDKGFGTILCADWAKVLGQYPETELEELGLKVQEERLMLTLAGRQAELIHYTLHSPAESDKAITEMARRAVPLNGMDTNGKQHLVGEALGLVTRHWHEIECLAAWLTRQHRLTIPSAELRQQVTGIHPDDHGLFP